jgi:hypothetical protein
MSLKLKITFALLALVVPAWAVQAGVYVGIGVPVYRPGYRYYYGPRGWCYFRPGVVVVAPAVVAAPVVVAQPAPVIVQGAPQPVYVIQGQPGVQYVPAPQAAPQAAPQPVPQGSNLPVAPVPVR